MRTNLSRLVKALKAQEPPKLIWQQPFDYNPSHYKKLCNLKGAPPSSLDLIDYAHDMLYGKSPLQPDLLRYMLPICLDSWHKDLLDNGQSVYGGFVEYFWVALAKPSLLQDHLTPGEYAAVETFMADAILDRIDQENELSFAGMDASPYTWFHAIGSFCVVFPALPSLWKRWWEMTTQGQACAVLQYLSCLLYEEGQNPIFSPWCQVGGGGPPCLWETAGLVYEKGWREENVKYLQATLTTAFIEDRLRYAARILKEGTLSPVPQQMINDFSEQETLLTLRLEQLPALLLASPMSFPQWTI